MGNIALMVCVLGFIVIGLIAIKTGWDMLKA